MRRKLTRPRSPRRIAVSAEHQHHDVNEYDHARLSIYGWLTAEARSNVYSTVRFGVVLQGPAALAMADFQLPDAEKCLTIIPWYLIQRAYSRYSTVLHDARHMHPLLNS